jgi:hypothetical protein
MARSDTKTRGRAKARKQSARRRPTKRQQQERQRPMPPGNDAGHHHRLNPVLPLAAVGVADPDAPLPSPIMQPRADAGAPAVTPAEVEEIVRRTLGGLASNEPPEPTTR